MNTWPLCKKNITRERTPTFEIRHITVFLNKSNSINAIHRIAGSTETYFVPSAIKDLKVGLNIRSRKFSTKLDLSVPISGHVPRQSYAGNKDTVIIHIIVKHENKTLRDYSLDLKTSNKKSFTWYQLCHFFSKLLLNSQISFFEFLMKFQHSMLTSVLLKKT